MPIEIRWDDAAQTIIREDFAGNWTWEQFFAMSAQAAEMMKSVDHRVDILCNMQNGTMPLSGMTMSNSRKVLRDLPPNWGIIVIVTNSVISVFANIFKKFDPLLGAHMFTSPDVDYAYKTISTERANHTLPD